jgi:pyruvate,water dikinase
MAIKALSAAPVRLADARDERELGGKAVQLGAALRAGLPVPDGVALPASLVETAAAGKPAAAAALSDLYTALAGPLAVRSSCVGEDSTAASFAGQHLTRLNVRSAEQLIEAVTAVWRSGRDESALAYRRKLGLEGEPKMGVVVQALVEPEVAGVLFTRHPVTGADERVIEAAWGLGESVVQGLVTPDLYRIDPCGEVIERLPGRKDIAIRSLPSGGTSEQPLASDLVDEPCLDDRQLALLHDLACRCEAAFEGPSDVEWAYANQALYLLQRRAITRTPA